MAKMKRYLEQNILAVVQTKKTYPQGLAVRELIPWLAKIDLLET